MCDLVVIATKAQDVETAAHAAKPIVGPETVVLPIQNGLGSADRVASVLGEERVAIGVVGGFGASVVGPGHVHHNGWELVRLGERRVLRRSGSTGSRRCGRTRAFESRPTTTSTSSSGRS